MLKAKDFHQNVAILFSILCHSAECKSCIWAFVDISFLLNILFPSEQNYSEMSLFFD